MLHINVNKKKEGCQKKFGSMSIAHVIYSIVTQKKHETQKNIPPHRNHDFDYFFVNRLFRTRYEK